MKKLMFAAALCAAMTGLADVTSANIVGYMTDGVRTDIEAHQVFTMLSVPFAGVDGGMLPITDLKFTGVAKTDFPSEYGDIIQIWDKTEGRSNQYYCYLGGEDDPDDGKWFNCNGDAPLTEDYEDGIASGSAFWYVVDMTAERDGVPAMTVAGAVDMEPFYTWPIRIDQEAHQVFTMLSNPYPVAWMIADGDCEIEGIAKTDFPSEYGDIIQIWDKTEGRSNQYYCYLGGEDDPDDGKWFNCNGDAPLTEDYENGGIPAGSALWYVVDMTANRDTNPSITFYNPLKKSAE